MQITKYISFVHLRNIRYVLLAHFNVIYKAKLSNSTLLFCAYAVLGAARTFETQIDSLPLHCSLLLAHFFICATTLRYVLLAHLHAYATLCHVLLAHFSANYKGKPAPSTSTFCAPTHPKMCY